ncbi:UDP-forming cellulose synthase catalytic subunit [Terriglobus tenax]|uniref:UDP-forming cellulose synthase catalytic subunit n=1 Tax=Terriglobus tenax TaxID=1111115 RepID=UPI0021DF8804|nr:UDP-forming cellulose synthase catalytic subunit [Terriglobus tenax]
MRVVRWLIVLVALFFAFQFISLYLSWQKQAILGAVLVVTALVMNRVSTSKVVTISLMLLSVTATTRYGWWRIGQLVDYFSDEANNPYKIDSILMLILLGAEVYTILIMVLGYIQTVWPLQRRPVPLPADEAEWPDVDLLIPTYNEPLSLVRYTALAALNIDYPPEKLHVYILDDGVRDEYRQFCEEAGIGYKVREKHTHAKAGNINTALETMDSPLVSIFDCDHVPTRSFLQMTVGWFLKDEKLAMLQTPHHFYSADPFERNLQQYRTIPNEGELFYGIIQDGNDLWNATFFCGSCAVIRRKALDEVGGIATETVTEDAHTSLRLQKLGYNTAYLNIAMAAGLATETLAAHVGQRIRWARGMIQILRIDNPLLARGMKWTQRMCYFNAMAHFLYAIPRLVFLCAPLMYMIFSRTIIPGYWVAILAYALPHLIISSMTNSRVQGTHRHSFWNEIYETVLAPYILMPTTLALLNPKLGKFNVTDKGSTLMETRFDSSIAAPTSWLLLFNLIGLAMAPYRYLVTDPTHPGTVLSNAAWILFNIIILGVAAACAHEQKQRRKAVRIEAKIAIRMWMPDGTECSGNTYDISVGGASIVLDGGVQPQKGDIVEMSFPLQTKSRTVKARVLAILPDEIRVAFYHPSVVEQETLARVLYSRADSWVSIEREVEVDRPLISFLRVTRLSMTGLYQVTRGLFSSKNVILFAVLLLGGLAHGQTSDQQFAPPQVQLPSQTYRPPSVGNEPSAPVPVKKTAVPKRVTPASVAAPQPAAAKPAAAAPVQTAPVVAPAPTSVNASLLAAPSASVPVTGKVIQITLKEMGVDGALELRGPHNYYPVGFSLPYTFVARRAVLKVSYKLAPSVIPHAGMLRVSVNNTNVGDLPVVNTGGYAYAELELPSDALIRSNGLTFEFTSNGVFQTEAQAKATAQGWIGASSIVEVTGDTLPFRNDISLLPMPFLDRDLQTPTNIPFVFLSQPGLKTLQAAGIVASWFGTQVGPRPIRYTASVEQLTSGNAVLFAENASKLPESLRPAQPEPGPYVAMRANPYDANGTVLIIAGNDEDQLLAAARGLALRKGALTTKVVDPGQGEGDTLRINDATLPATRGVDDAPRWMPTNRLISLADYASKDQLKTDGSHPVPIYFHVPPDLFYGEVQNLRMLVSYRYNSAVIAPGSALRTYVNGTLVNEAPLQQGGGVLDRQRQIVVPVAAMRPFGNTLQFSFDFIPVKTGAPTQGEILANSALDIRTLPHYASLPDLELFANAAFPFTRRADLSETTVILPASPTANEISLYLHLMSHSGSQTGYPALRLEVAGPDAVLGKDRDYLVLGSVQSQPVFQSLGTSLPVTLSAEGIQVREEQGALAQIKDQWQRLIGRLVTREVPSNEGGRIDAMIEGVESPVSPGRSIILVALRDDGAAVPFEDVFVERSQSSDIGSSVSLLRGGRFESYGMNSRVYHVGNLSPYRIMRIWMAQYFISLVIAMVAFSLVLAVWLRQFIADRARARLAVGYEVVER